MHLVKNFCFILLLLNYGILAQTEYSLEENSPLELTKLKRVLRNAPTKYRVSLSIPDSERSESIVINPLDGQLSVKGSINTYYPDSLTNLRVNYVADKNGYRASYQILQTQPPLSSVSFQTRLSSSDLKSLAG